MTWSRRRLPGALVVLVLPLAGCTSTADTAGPGSDAPESEAPVVQLGAPGEDNRTLSPEEIGALGQPGHTEADAEFVRGMIPHHRQALQLTALVDKRTGSERIAMLAERIEVSQVAEIAQLEGWLTQRGGSLPDEHGHHPEPMPGMLTEEELAHLGAARGTRFDRLFLRYMIRHHEGAVVMVEVLLAGEGGQEAEVFQLARHIASDQVVEISRMKRMLAGPSS